MSVPLLVLTAGASLGIGAVAAPALASVLSQPITGHVVPTRITDLAGYLVGGGGAARGLADTGQSIATGFEDEANEQSVDTTVGAVTTPANQGSTVNAPRATIPKNEGPATADQKRLLAVASFGGGLAIAVATFFLVRRVLQ